MRRQHFISALGLIAVLVIGGLIAWKLIPTDPAEATQTVEQTPAAPVNQVHLTAAKLKSADIEIGTAETRVLQQTLSLPGRLTYDEERHVSIQAACQGIVRELRFRPGDSVKQGQVVAVVSSPTIASARVQVRNALANLNLAKQQRQWNQDICSGVEELVALVREGKSPEEIEESLRDESLGAYREKLVSAYTRNLLAKQSAASSREAADRGAIAKRLQMQRESERQAAEAAIEAIAEQSLYEVQLGCNLAAAKLAEAERESQLSQQNLDTLLGPAAEQVSVEELEGLDDATLPLVNLVAPIDGTIEERLVATSERVDAQTPVYTIANTSRLWAVADVRQNDWAAMNVQRGSQVKILIPASQHEEMDGEVLFVGRVVNPDSGAAQLIARLKNATPNLRPGNYVRLSVPVGEPLKTLTVPEQSVMLHENQHFVFVAKDEATFERVDVTLGETIAGLTEILDGLEEGTRIATAGVFKLKSELLLAGEEE